jgi:hypothetical protein
MLVHRAPDLVPADPTLPLMADVEVDQALAGLEAVMPSKGQQMFESLATYVGSVGYSSSHWKGAAGVTSCLLREAKTEAQMELALGKARELITAVGSKGARACDLDPDTLRVFLHLHGTLHMLESQMREAVDVQEMLRQTLNLGEDVQDLSGEEPSVPSMTAPSDLTPLRPQTIPTIGTWLTTGAKRLMRTTGRLYHEVELGGDFSDIADPQMGWLTDQFVEKDYDCNGVGDDTEGWAADGVRQKQWHNGPADAAWPRCWRGRDVIGFAVDVDAGQLEFSLNGEWVKNAQMTFQAAGRSVFPAVSTKGRFTMNIPKGSWQFTPPSPDYQAWAEEGVYTRPVQVVAPPELPSLERQTSRVNLQLPQEPEQASPVCRDAGELDSSNVQAFAEAVARKALTENLAPHLEACAEEFRRVVPHSVRNGLSWQQVQDRVSGRRLDSTSSFVQEWRSRTTYHSCGEDDESVKQWWSYVSERTAEELPVLFAWCTGFAAIPVTAWKFQIRAVEDTSLFPTINTCMTDDPSAANLGVKMPTMYLPAYDSKSTLTKRMEWAIAGASTLNLH